jgi:HK97 family phage major capsid protein
MSLGVPSVAAEISAAAVVLRDRHPERAREINEAANSAIREDLSVGEFSKQVLDILSEKTRYTPASLNRQGDGLIGMSARDVNRYSIFRAIRNISENRPLDGLEREASDEVARKLERAPKGFYLPDEVVNQSRRTLLATSSTEGGYSVGSEVLGSETVAVLRASSHVIELGARVISGLTGDVTIPRQLTGAAAFWVSETGSITQSNATFGQIVARPRRIGTSVPYTKQFLAQTSLAAEAFVINDAIAAIGVDVDRVALRGIGGAEPLGIANMAAAERSTSVNFGAAATYAKVLEFEANLAGNNALVGVPAFITTPAVRAKWKAAPRIAAAGAMPIWASDADVAGYRARATNQLLTTATPVANMVIFGDFSQVLYCEWVGLDVVIDPFSQKREGIVEVTIQRLIDVIVRQGKSFAISSDSGAQ